MQAKLTELDATVAAQRDAITLLDNAIARISRDGIPPNVLTTESIHLLDLKVRVTALERGEVSILRADQ